STMVSYMLFVFGIIGIIANRVSGKMLNQNVANTTALFLSGTILIPVLLHFSGTHPIAVFLVIILWGFLYSPSFLNASTYMISSAPESLEFANSLATSFGNMGITVGTTVGGWMIATKGVQYTPWLTLVFGLLAFTMILTRNYLERKA
ncbi:MAG: MFS transporter, partial [Flavobacterium sp.]|nr:MFS transporter [Flavobacterium sp.]